MSTATLDLHDDTCRILRDSDRRGGVTDAQVRRRLRQHLDNTGPSRRPGQRVIRSLLAELQTAGLIAGQPGPGRTRWRRTQDPTGLALWAQLGDHEAYGRLWQQHHQQVAALVRHITPTGVVDDIVAEAFTTAWRKIGQWRPEAGPFLPWLLAIARNTAIDHMRRASRRPETGAVDLAMLPADDDPAADAATRDEVRRVRHALAALTPRQQQVIVARHFRGMSITQTATALGLSEGNVKSTCSRALVALRAAVLALPAHLSATLPPLPDLPVVTVPVEAAPTTPESTSTAAPAPTTNLPSPRRAHAVTPTRPRGARPTRRCRRLGLAVVGRMSRPTGSSRPGPTTAGNPQGGHRSSRPDPRRPRVEATGPPSGNPRRLGAAQQRPAGPGTPHGTGRPGAAAAGAIVSALAMWTWTLAAAAFLVACALFWLSTATDTRRSTRQAYRALDPIRDGNEKRLKEIGRLYREIHAPAESGGEHAPTVQPTPEAWLSTRTERKARRRTGRHWRATP